MATAQATAQPEPRPVRLVFTARTALVVISLPPLGPGPRTCEVCHQDAVAFDPHGLGWCQAHASLELLCP